MVPYADGWTRWHPQAPGGPPSPGRRAGVAGMAGGEDAPRLAGEEREEVLLQAVRRRLDNPPHLAPLPGDDEGRNELDLVVRDGSRRLLLLPVDAYIVDPERDGAARFVESAPQARHL